MEYRYFYIDDENSLQGIIAGLTKPDVIVVDYHEPNKDWNEEVDFFDKNHTQIDGLLLDLRLEDNINKIEYRGSTLAQEIRTRQKEKKMSTFPIVLFSANDKLLESLDKTAKDLFDFCQEKSELNNFGDIPEFRNRLISLAAGYKKLSRIDKKTFENILTTNELCFLDKRFVNNVEEQLKLPIHNIAKFIISELLDKQGYLISELVLAARLGIDKDKSLDWTELLELLSASKYDGIFSDFWIRWWMPVIDSWWYSSVSHNKYLRSLSSTQRVDLIKEKTGLQNLSPIIKNEKCSSDSFWTICKGTNIPIDTVDGLVISNQENLYPWQDKEYVSIYEALEETNKNAWKDILPSEKIRLEKLKKIFGNVHRIRK